MLLQEFRPSASQLADYLPWSHLLRADVVGLKDGAWLAGFVVQGHDSAAMDQVDRVALRSRLSACLAQLGGGWALWVEQRADPTPSYPLSLGDAAPKVLQLMEQERRRLFEADRQMHTTTLFWVCCYSPVQQLKGFDKSASFLIDDHKDERQAEMRAIWLRFLEDLDQFEGLLAGSMASVVRLEANGLLSALTTSIATTPQSIQAPAIPTYLDAWLPTADLLPGTRPKLGDHHLRVITVRDLPGSTTPAMLDSLKHLSFPYRWCSRWLALDRDEARRLMRTARRRWVSKARPALSVMAEMLNSEASDQTPDPEAALMINDSDAALASLADAGVAYGLYSAAIIVSDPDPGIADARAGDVMQLLAAAGLPAKRETFGAADVWLSCVPGDVKANVRRLPMHSLGLADLIPHQSCWLGDQERTIAMLRNGNGEAFRFGLYSHGSDVGHTAIIGPTGAGKSVLLSFLALSWLRHDDHRVLIIDRHMSCRAAVLAADGVFHKLDGADCAFQPLRAADDTAANWLIDALVHVGVEIDQAIRLDVFRVIKLLRDMPEDERTLTTARHLLAQRRLREALTTLPDWFDAIEAALAPARIEAFETDHLLRHKAAPLAISYLVRRLEQRFDGAPTLLILDEAWWALGHASMGSAIDDWLRTLRKRNVAVVFATQALSDLVSSTFASTLLEQVPNRIFLPNARALEPVTKEIYASLGLGRAMIELIGASTPKRDYIVQSPSGVQQVDLALGDIARSVLARSTPQDQTVLENTPQEQLLDVLLGLNNDSRRAHGEAADAAA